MKRALLFWAVLVLALFTAKVARAIDVKVLDSEHLTHPAIITGNARERRCLWLKGWDHSRFAPHEIRCWSLFHAARTAPEPRKRAG
jgi:hypothetical protein